MISPVQTPQIKVCGLCEEGGVRAALETGVDWLGLVFFPRSPRYIEPLDAAALMDGVPLHGSDGGPGRVGLFVDADDQTLSDVLGQVRLDLIQLHGKETPERAAEIRDEFGLPVMKALAVETRADLDAAQSYVGICDYILLDARAPKGADRPGGNAVSFDWSILEGWQAPLPWWLAGGLTPDNVADAVRRTRPFAVDVSSGVEAAPGIKDPHLINRFVDAVEGAV